MERKIGEIFEHNSEWYQCIEDTERISCINCCFYNGGHKLCTDESIGVCISEYRSDKKSICFKKLEKVGEPYKFQKRTIQTYKLYTEPFISFDMDFINTYLNGSDTIDIIIKQNIEDMEEKKLNLKPFDIQKAREGKPVCTRDGRKARIICFDSKNDPQRPVVALVEHNDNELLYEYTIEGKDRFSHISTTGTSDLMMLPEKKEGWVNVYKERIYSTKEEAIEATYDGVTYIDTIKISWEE